MLPAFLTTILFSISAVSATRTTRLLGGNSANFWRMLLATVCLGIWAHWMGQGLEGRAFPIFLLSGFIGFGVGDVALYQALPRLGSRLSILIVHCLAAPFAGVTEWLWLDYGLSGAEMASSATILVGVAVALAPGRGEAGVGNPQFGVGVLYALFAAFGQGAGAVLSRKAYDVAEAAGQEIDGMTAAYQRILAGLVVAGIFLCLARWRQQGRTEKETVKARWRAAWPWVVVNGFSGPALGVSCYQWALKSTPTGIVLPIVAMTPLVVVPFSRYMEGERPSWRSLLGGGIAVAGVVALTLV